VSPNKERYWKKIYTDARSLEGFFPTLRRIDDWVLDRVPLLGRLCWNTVVTVEQPHKATGA